MAEIFRTNVANKQDAQKVLALISSYFPGLEVNFDLEDRDKILRIVGAKIAANEIIDILKECGYSCEMLDFSIEEKYQEGHRVFDC